MESRRRGLVDATRRTPSVDDEDESMEDGARGSYWAGDLEGDVFERYQ